MTILRSIRPPPCRWPSRHRSLPALSVQNSAACPLTLANGFNPCAVHHATTFAVDPELPCRLCAELATLRAARTAGSLQMTATYLGIKGTRGVQEFLPNTYPIGATNPCPACPTGFVYRTSNGNSTRQAGSIQLRRRLRNGFTRRCNTPTRNPSTTTPRWAARALCRLARARAECCRPQPSRRTGSNLRAERGLSTFDQRHLLEPTNPIHHRHGNRRGTLLTGWRGRRLEGVDRRCHDCRRQRIAGDPHLSGGGERHRRHGQHPS